MDPVQGTDFEEAHRALLADTSIQFQFPRHEPLKLPDWLVALGDFLSRSSPTLRVLFWLIVAAAILFVLYILARWLSGASWPWHKTLADAEEPVDWRPEEAPARALLREADALAAEARFSEAAHLLLFRSIEEIDSRRPDLVRPALTSRDIAGAPALPHGPRQAFSAIVMLVERSLFAGRDLAEQDWRQCRAAYEEFAFAGAWR